MPCVVLLTVDNLSALSGAFFLCVIHISTMSLPIDPDECIWTPEGQAYAEEQARRAYQARLAAMEELAEIHALRRTSYGR